MSEIKPSYKIGRHAAKYPEAMEQLCVRIPIPVLDAIKAEARRRGVAKAEVVRPILEKYFTSL